MSTGLLEYVIRVKLPSPGAYAPGPSGDSDYQDAYDAAISEAMPPGFEVVPLRLTQKYAVDSDGRSMVLIRPTDNGVAALSHYVNEVKRLSAALAKIKGLIPRDIE